MNINYCSICSTSFDFDEEGDKGMIGMIPFAFCPTCRNGILEYADIACDEAITCLTGALETIRANSEDNAVSLSPVLRIQAFNQIAKDALAESKRLQEGDD
jgi:hypothetical protein